MSATTSATTGRRYGIQRVFQGLGALAVDPLRTAGAGAAPGSGASRHGAGRRRPTRTNSCWPAVRADLARSPFQGEGHRKVHAGCGSWTGSASPGPECCA